MIPVISPIIGGGVAALKMFLEWYNKPTLSYVNIFKEPDE
jgi:hypothetical protein